MKYNSFREWLVKNIDMNEELYKKYDNRSHDAWEKEDTEKALWLDDMKYHFESDQRIFTQVLYMFDLLNEES